MDDNKKLVTKDAYWYKTSTAKVTVFPQEHFSGCDVQVSFEGQLLGDIMSLNFQLQEQIRPIYGYSSRVYDALAIGNRIVTGSLVLAFSTSNRMKDLIKHSDGEVKKRLPAAIAKSITSTKDKIQISSGAGFSVPTLSTDGVSPGMSIDNLSLTGTTRENIVAVAKTRIGYPYVYGTEGDTLTKAEFERLLEIHPSYVIKSQDKHIGKQTFDCSGFVYWVYNKVGIKIPREGVTTMVKKSYMTKIDKSQLRPGDLCCVSTGQGGYNHMGIYIGNSKIIEAANRADGVKESPLPSGSSRWTDFYTCTLQATVPYMMEGPSVDKKWPGANIHSIDYREKELCRGEDLWLKRYNSRNIIIDELEREIVNSDEFSYEPKSPLKMTSRNMKFTNLKYMPIGRANKVVLYHSIETPIDIENLHHRMKTKNKGGIGVHFLIKKDGTIQCGMPICFSVEKDPAVHIIFEGYFDKEKTDENSSFDPENAGPTAPQLTSLIDLVNDLKGQMPALKSVYAAREYGVTNKGKEIGEETSPGVLFPMLSIGDLLDLERPTDIAHQFYNYYLHHYGVNTLDDLLDKPTIIETEDQGEFKLSVEAIGTTINDGGGSSKKYTADHVVKKFESGGNIASINFDSNDHYAFGLYQFNAASGLHSLMSYIKSKSTVIYDMLKGANTTAYYDTLEYRNKWKNVCNKYPTEFGRLQYDSAYATYCLGPISNAQSIARSSGMNFPWGNNIATINAVWSTAVQCGVGGFGIIFSRTVAKGKAAIESNEKNFLNEFYLCKRDYFMGIKNWTEKFKAQIVSQRVNEELKIVLSMIGASISNDFLYSAAAYYAPNDVTLLTEGVPFTIPPVIPSTIKSGTVNSFVTLLQQVMNASGVSSPMLIVDGSYGPKTKTAVKAFENKYGISGKIVDGSGNITQAGWTEFKKIVDSKQIMNGSITQGISTDPGNVKYNETNGSSMAELTSSIWGFDQIEPGKDERQAYFYNDDLPHVQLSGIDVTIKYGYEFDGTNYIKQVEKLKNVQLRSVGKQFDTSGEPIAEVYEFIARDIE